MSEKSVIHIDLLTVIGLAAVAYVVSTLGHEGLGHGGMCIVLGQKSLVWGAYYFDCATKDANPVVWRLVAAAGSTVNLLVMIIAFLWLSLDLERGADHPRGAGTVFAWLMFALNGFQWAGYFLFSGVANIGDWSSTGQNVLAGVPWALPARIVMAVAGAGLYFLIGRTAGGLLGQIIGGKDRQVLLSEGRKLAWAAYFTGAVVSISVGFLNPVGIMIVLVSSAASSMGGTSGFLWQHMFMTPGPQTVFVLKRNWLWLAAGIVAAAGYAVVWGPSLKL